MYIIDDQDNTELHIAAQNNQLQKVWSIMRKNINLNLKNKAGETALHSACKYHHMDIVEYIVRFGGKLNIKNNEGKTPLDYLTESEKNQLEEFQDRIFGLGKYKFIELEKNSHVFMGDKYKILRE